MRKWLFLILVIFWLAQSAYAVVIIYGMPAPVQDVVVPAKAATPPPIHAAPLVKALPRETKSSPAAKPPPPLMRSKEGGCSGGSCPSPSATRWRGLFQ